jgi:hypothetical protein
MNKTVQKNENPFVGLIGVWKGDKGVDIAPKPGEDENNEYYETLTFEAIHMDIENAESQALVAVRYHQVVREKSNNKVSHDETGYWIWDKMENTIMLTFSIPRGVCVLATGGFVSDNSAKEIVFNASTKIDTVNSGILQSSFMLKNAKTTKFKREIRISGDELYYSQQTSIEIYDKAFDHTDENILRKQI